VAAEDHDGDPDGASPLERRGHRLGTATGNPRVIDDDHALARDAIIDPDPARVDLPAAGQRLRARGEPDRWRCEAWRDQGG
jgi:hypothetical protein